MALKRRDSNLRKRLFGLNTFKSLKVLSLWACALFLSAVSFSATGYAQTKTLRLYNTHTKESVSITFKKNGRFIPSGLREANRFLRDWRRNEITTMDPELLDLVWDVYRKVGAKKPIYVVSGYRSPATNGMLRSRSKGVAKNSQHMRGKAMDFYIPGVNLYKLRVTGLRKQVGGVGYYPRSRSPFVHMDTGSVRHWPRMTRSQLVKVFPNGRTLHVPSDGKPLSGYKLALADEKSGKHGASKSGSVSNSRNSVRISTRNQELTDAGAVIRPGSRNGGDENEGDGNFFSTLFGGDKPKKDIPNKPGRIAPAKQKTPVAETQVAAISPVIENAPVPAFKQLAAPEASTAETTAETQSDPIIVAGIAPRAKPERPAPVVLAEAQPADIPLPNTLDAQKARLEQGKPAQDINPASSGRFEVATALPGQKPGNTLLAAATQKAAQQARIPVPASAPAKDPMSAIFATAVAKPQKPASPKPGSALAFNAPAPATAATFASQKNDVKRSLAGRIPRNEIRDPLAGFAKLAVKSENQLISGESTMRNQKFAALVHPKQRVMSSFLSPGNRFVKSGFTQKPYGQLRADRFDGPAVIVLPVTFAR